MYNNGGKSVREIDRILGLNGEWEESFSMEVNKEKLTTLI